jgi:hypothetical protein
VDAAVMPFLRRQRRPSSAPRAGIQSRQLHADAGDAHDGGAVVAAGLREKLIKIGAKVVSHGRYVRFQLTEVAVPRQMFQEILMLITRLRTRPPQHDGLGSEGADHDGRGAA